MRNCLVVCSLEKITRFHVGSVTDFIPTIFLYFTYNLPDVASWDEGTNEAATRSSPKTRNFIFHFSSLSNKSNWKTDNLFQKFSYFILNFLQCLCHYLLFE